MIPNKRTPIPVIVDTDAGIDDMVAILLAIASPEIEILAFIVTYGNTYLDAAYLNILKAYRVIEHHLAVDPTHKYRFPNFRSTKIPIVARGAERPLAGERRLALSFHGRDGLGNIAERHPELSTGIHPNAHPYLELTNKSGIDVALEILKKWPPRSVTIITLGPLTNLALMMRKERQVVSERIGQVICMGGALDVPGNKTAVAEFNVFSDPYAVEELLISLPPNGIPLDRFTLIPLDITTLHELPFSVYRDAVDPSFENTTRPSCPNEKSPLTHFTSSFLERFREIMLVSGKDAMELHDIVAVWCAIEHPPPAEGEALVFAQGWGGHRRTFQVECLGEHTRGMLVVDRRKDDGQSPDHLVTRNAPSVGDKRIICLNKTPGIELLLTLLLDRVWGCSLSERSDSYDNGVCVISVNVGSVFMNAKGWFPFRPWDLGMPLLARRALTFEESADMLIFLAPGISSWTTSLQTPSNEEGKVRPKRTAIGIGEQLGWEDLLNSCTVNNLNEIIPPMQKRTDYPLNAAPPLCNKIVHTVLAKWRLESGRNAPIGNIYLWTKKEKNGGEYNEL